MLETKKHYIKSVIIHGYCYNYYYFADNTIFTTNNNVRNTECAIFLKFIHNKNSVTSSDSPW